MIRQAVKTYRKWFHLNLEKWEMRLHVWVRVFMFILRLCFFCFLFSLACIGLFIELGRETEKLIIVPWGESKRVKGRSTAAVLSKYSKKRCLFESALILFTDNQVCLFLIDNCNRHLLFRWGYRHFVHKQPCIQHAHSNRTEFFCHWNRFFTPNVSPCDFVRDQLGESSFPGLWQSRKAKR